MAAHLTHHFDTRGGCLVLKFRTYISIFVLIALVAAPTAILSGARAAFVVVIDAGHGGHDNGAKGFSGTLEKDVVLEVVKLIRIKALSMPDLDVILTRTNDNYVELLDRASIANNAQADLYISVHANAHSDARANGVETWVADRISGTKREESLAVAESLQSSLLQEMSPVRNRGVKSQQLYLRHADMPSALVELGFLTNPHEEVSLNRFNYQVKAADAILDGIMNYLENN
jgi:N-acetylmuramoyl-L-alanine amidase